MGCVGLGVGWALGVAHTVFCGQRARPVIAEKLELSLKQTPILWAPRTRPIPVQQLKTKERGLRLQLGEELPPLSGPQDLGA